MKVQGNKDHPSAEVMLMVTNKVALSLCMGALLLAACSENTTKLGSTHVKDLEIGPAGGSLEIFASDNAPTITGARIAIPEGALDRTVKIAIGLGDDDIVDATGRAIGPVVDFGPDGTMFAKPAVITLPYNGDPNTRRLTVWMKSGSTLTAIPPHQLTLDGENKRVRFQINHFTDFQCGEGNEPPACDPNECGPQPALPSWICADGTPGGPTNNCIRNSDGTCGWEIHWCEPACDPSACGPQPAIAAVCPDGTPASVVCEADSSGQCGWNFDCPNNCGPSTGTGQPTDPNGNLCPGDCTVGQPCPDGTLCDANGQCSPTGVSCGANTCGAGQYCCNESCGICANIGDACPAIACPVCSDGTQCAPGQQCDPNGGCTGGNACGPTTCPSDQYCCNASCGLCAPIGQACTQTACAPCGTDPNSPTCPPGDRCDANGQCVPQCGPNDCGPPLGLANWMCDDGTIGGPTGNCIPMPSTVPPGPSSNGCGWEIINCPAACDLNECGPQPGLPNYTCPDGTIAGPTGECHRAADGSCGWVIINCPMTGN